MFKSPSHLLFSQCFTINKHTRYLTSVISYRKMYSLTLVMHVHCVYVCMHAHVRADNVVRK